jgi:cell division protein FtsN
MKKLLAIVFSFAVLLVVSSCGTTTKTTKKTIESEKSKVPVAVSRAEKELQKEKNAAEDSITVRQEKLVEAVGTPVPSEKFFVIIGSFRVPENVEKYKKEMRAEGFSPFVLRNEEGLYRVAVFSYDDEKRARDKVRAIKRAFPHHDDTWLLIKAE